MTPILRRGLPLSSREPDQIEREDAAAAQQRVRDFIVREGRLAEESRFQDWLELWHEESLYWIPIGDPSSPSQPVVAIIRDNRQDLADRIRRLESGLVHSQVPPSRWVRVWGAIEVERAVDDAISPVRARGAWKASASFHVVEVRHGARRDWTGRADYILTESDAEALKILRKTVWLVDRDTELPPLMFMI